MSHAAQHSDARPVEHSSPAPGALRDEEEVVVAAGRTGGRYWRDLWRYRELFVFLAWRDLKVRYKQTAIGVAWAVIRPLVAMVILTIVFGRLAGMPTPKDVPYALLVMAAMLPWQFFSGALAECGNSLLANTNLITKVYFPRLIIPAGVLLVVVVDMLVAGVLLLGMMAWYGFAPSANAVALPAFLLLALAAGLGAGLWLSALMVKYRDFRFVVPFIMQFGLYVSPVGFSSDIVPEPWRPWYALNPMVGIIEGFRWSLLGTDSLDVTQQAVSGAGTLLFLVSGFWYFRRTERGFADAI
jgi:lipopolysaccharide transport system permease protein